MEKTSRLLDLCQLPKIHLCKMKKNLSWYLLENLYFLVLIYKYRMKDKLNKLDFDDKKNAEDEMIENNGIKLLVNKKSFLYLVGTTLEFSDGLNGKGFVFNNPNANRTCGCGESFSL